MTTVDPAESNDDLLQALRRQKDVDDHDRGLIVERLSWTPAQRLDGNVAGETLRQPSIAAPGAVRSALIEAMAAEPDVVAAYLFGSLARGAAGPLSDVDVGLLIDKEPAREPACDRTMDALCRGLRTARVDVVSLKDAPVPLRYRVVRDGSLVVCRNAVMVERFVAETVLQYLDFKPLRDRAFAVMRRAILENR